MEYPKRKDYKVPVITDSVPGEVPSDLVRCIYFYITADGPSTGWLLGLPQAELPFLMLGLQGIIYRPATAATEFDSPALLSQLIKEVELQEGFTVETGCIWIPAGLLQRSKRLVADSEAERGDVFRVDLSLFASAWGVAYENADVHRFIDDTNNIEVGQSVPEPLIYFSPVETNSISSWSIEQITAHQSFGKKP